MLFFSAGGWAKKWLLWDLPAITVNKYTMTDNEEDKNHYKI